MRPTRQLSCLLLREREKALQYFLFCAVCTIWGCSVCFILSFSLLRERKYGASKTVTTERATASDGSNPLCPLLPFQTANASLVCGLEPEGISISLRLRRNQSLRNEALRSKASYSDALFLLLRCRPQAGSASQKPLWFSWIFPAQSRYMDGTYRLRRG